MNGLMFGTAGVPISAMNRNSLSGISRVKELGLSCMEVEFVRGVKMGDETASQLGEIEKNNVFDLTSHIFRKKKGGNGAPW